MIQPQTCLNVADNSGAKKLMCIRILGTNRRYGFIGNVIIGVVKDATPNLTVKRSDVVRAVIVRTKHSITRKDGTRLRFDDNASVIINKENNFDVEFYIPRQVQVTREVFVKSVLSLG